MRLRTARRRRGVNRGDDGFTIIEMVVSLCILAVVLLAMAATLESALTVTRNNRNRVVAASLVAQAVDLLRSTPFGTIQLGRTTSASTVGSVTYTSTVDVTPTPPPGVAADGCGYASGGSNADYLVADVSVTWPDMSGAAPAQASTMIAPPATIITGDRGTVIIEVVGPNGPESGVAVTSPTTGQTVTTTANGCAPFYNLSSGQGYTFTANNYIDANRVYNPTWTLTTLGRGQTVEHQVQWAPPATITVNIAMPSGALIGQPVSPARGFGFALSGPIVDPAAAGNSFLVYPSGSYQAWAGDCPDAWPQSGTNVLVTTINAAPGSSAVASVPLYSVLVTPTAQVTAGSTTITATHTGSGCPTTAPAFTYTAAAASIPPPTTTTTTTVPRTTTTVASSTTTPAPTTTSTTAAPTTTTTTTQPLAPPPHIALPAGTWLISWGGQQTTITVPGSLSVTLGGP